MRKAIVLACLFATGMASPVLAANARHPYANCDKKVDNCGPTGDNVTDQLNAQQLGGGGAGQGMGAPMGGPGMGAPMGGPGMAPMGGPGMPPMGGPGMPPPPPPAGRY